jgi:agmatine deiminase
MPNRLPGEWEPHQMTIVAWPSRPEVWGDQIRAAYAEYGELVRSISKVEDVLVVAHQKDVERVASSLRDCNVSILAFPIDDGWIRDNGPLFCDTDGRLVGVDFGFNSWGDRFSPSDGDRAIGEALCRHLGVSRIVVPWVLEGGSISSNGDGLILASAEAVLHPNRNGSVSSSAAEDLFEHYLGASNTLWVPHGLLEDLKNTDGHVDNVAVFVSQDVVLVQGCADDNPNSFRLRENYRRLRSDAPQLTIITCERLPYVRLPNGDVQPAPYLNFVLANGIVLLPTVGSDSDGWATSFFGDIWPDREVVFTSARTLTYGGGGPHCVTMQVPGRSRLT